MTIITYYAGAAPLPGTSVTSNVTGNCGHRHRSAEAAEACIAATDRAIKRYYGQNSYCDRVVMVRTGPSDYLGDVHPLHACDDEELGR